MRTQPGQREWVSILRRGMIERAESKERSQDSDRGEKGASGRQEVETVGEGGDQCVVSAL